jgi:transposase
MARITARKPLQLNEKEREMLSVISRSQTHPARKVRRAKLFVLYDSGASITDIARDVGLSRESVYKWIDRALAIGAAAALDDKYHRPKEPEITEVDKAWVIDLACRKPNDLGYAAELWTLKALAKHVRDNAKKEGHPALCKAAKATVWRILNKREIKPHKIRYYLEERDPDFENKMREVLLVYQEVMMLNERGFSPWKEPGVITLSVDEKPGVQAIKLVAPDLPPVSGKHSTIARDYEYERLGTLSILAALDLHDGHVLAEVEERHRSCEFIKLLASIDAYYPADCRIRLILDNHSAHISKETMEWLSWHPGRFEYVHTPKHGSWLNIVETLFGKMARTFLKAIRVESKEELRQRILQGIHEINMEPVVHRWKKFDLLNNSSIF